MKSYFLSLSVGFKIYFVFITALVLFAFVGFAILDTQLFFKSLIVLSAFLGFIFLFYFIVSKKNSTRGLLLQEKIGKKMAKAFILIGFCVFIALIIFGFKYLAIENNIEISKLLAVWF